MPDVYAEHALDSRRFIPDSDDGPLYMGRPIGDPATFWANVTARAEVGRTRYKTEPSSIYYCCRCGEPLPCTHINYSIMNDPERAERTRARYALGQELNPDHDTTDYSREPAQDPIQENQIGSADPPSPPAPPSEPDAS